MTSHDKKKKKENLAGTDWEEGVRVGEKIWCKCAAFKRERKLFFHVSIVLLQPK